MGQTVNEVRQVWGYSRMRSRAPLCWHFPKRTRGSPPCDQGVVRERLLSLLMQSHMESEVLKSVPCGDFIVLLGDFNAHIGNDRETLRSAIGRSQTETQGPLTQRFQVGRKRTPQDRNQNPLADRKPRSWWRWPAGCAGGRPSWTQVSSGSGQTGSRPTSLSRINQNAGQL